METSDTSNTLNDSSLIVLKIEQFNCEKWRLKRSIGKTARNPNETKFRVVRIRISDKENN